VSSRETLPQVFWPVLVIGGILCVLFTYFFHTQNIRAHAVMSGMLTVMIAATLYLYQTRVAKPYNQSSTRTRGTDGTAGTKIGDRVGSGG
jgi:lipid-A-disaccharide synthase-like uncharacterized protein